MELSKITKKEHEDTKRKILEILKENNFSETPYGYGWERETNVGRVFVSVGTHIKGSNLFSIFTRFEDPSRAKNRWNFDCNPHTGKYNFHFPKYALDELVENFDFFTSLITKSGDL